MRSLLSDSGSQQASRRPQAQQMQQGQMPQQNGMGQPQPTDTGFLSGIGGFSGLLHKLGQATDSLNSPQGRYNTSILGGGALDTAEQRLQMGLQQQQQQQQFDMQREEAERQRSGQEALQLALPEALQNLDVSNPGNAISELVKKGLDPKQATMIVSTLAQHQLERQKLSQRGSGDGMSALEQKLLFEKYRTDSRLQEKKQEKQEAILAKNEVDAEDATDLISELGQLETLLPEFHTGFGSDAAQLFHKTIGSGKKAAAYEQFTAGANKLALKAGEKLKGSFSDKDLAFLREQNPSTSNSEEGNKDIINGLRKAAQRKISYTEKAREWVEKGGDIKEFNRDWRKFVDAHPIFNEGIEAKNEENKSKEMNELAELDKIFGSR